MMKVLVVGTGSIGKRHIQNLLALGIEVLAYSYRRASQVTEGVSVLGDVSGVTYVDDWKAALRMPDVAAVVVANRTDLHVEVALFAVKNGLAVFIEKPLSNRLDNTQDVVNIAQEKDVRVESGFMLRCHPNMQWLKQQLQDKALGRILYARANVGQWLPDWRPNTDHRLGYGAKKETGGGVIFDLVHELDLLHWLIGDVKQVTAMTAQCAELEIETEAIAQIGLSFHSGAIAQVHLDYVRPDYGRNMEVVCTEGVYTWDYLAGQVYAQPRGDQEELVHQVDDGFERNDLFLTHMRAFVDGINDPTSPVMSPLDDALAVLKIALAAHESTEAQRHVMI